MKKIYALSASEREKECDHPCGFPYTGCIPCTGPRVCLLCGTDRSSLIPARIHAAQQLATAVAAAIKE